MHPLGFAYEADGAHVDKDELEAGVPPPGTNSACSGDGTCPVPKYQRKGSLMGGTVDGLVVGSEDGGGAGGEVAADFGLEAYEHMFYYPINQWATYGPFTVSLMFDDLDFASDIFYFCHIHSGMSGRIKFIDSEGTPTTMENTPKLPYVYDIPSDFDKKCGTYGLEKYQLPNDQCLSEYVCDVPDGMEQYSKCYDAMNCAMMVGMTTNVDDETSLFLHQMIPHHQNAVNMAKALLMTGDITCNDLTLASSEDGTVGGAESEDAALAGKDYNFCLMDALARTIIGEQNHQIQVMRSILDNGKYTSEADADCQVTVQQVKRHLKTVWEEKPQEAQTPIVEETKQESPKKRQLDGDAICKATCPADGDHCYFTAKINYFAGELGYYEFEECPELGPNPTLGMEKGTSYIFNQADVSNWMHPLGFAYFAGGAHFGVDELEAGIAPPGSNSPCADTLTCPAPMYSMAEEYQGVYSNNEKIHPVTSGEDDFGLDFIEGLYYRPLGDWVGYGEFTVSLLFDVENFDGDMFYFCHIHSGMSGRIKLIAPDGVVLQEENKPTIPYEYDQPSAFDQECGTFGLEGYTLPHDQCPPMFICNAPGGALEKYSKCYDAMNCAMAVGMTTYAENTVALFIHQMIPHHQNAVNMAKALLHSGKVTCDDVTVESDDCELYKVLVSVINHQNHQIQTMQGVLEGKSFKKSYDCVVPGSGPRSELELSENESAASKMAATILSFMAGIFLTCALG